MNPPQNLVPTSNRRMDPALDLAVPTQFSTNLPAKELGIFLKIQIHVGKDYEPVLETVQKVYKNCFKPLYTVFFFTRI